MIKRFLLVTIFSVTIAGLLGQDMDNPYILDNEWPGYSIGDPYVLKHRGVFYLYCSTKNGETGTKTWSSTDLVSWTYEGLSSTDPVTVTAYAPEVYYWNGTFYMYTSPGGNGHYILSAPSPTGPFEPVTQNLGKSIDGSVFVDDDGSWYFYHASPGGIIGCPMPDPVSIGTGTNTGSFMNNTWTEGSCVFKRNGIYYMIYTGNHVISKGYRIDYGTSTTSPIENFEPADNQNPILLDALGLHNGLGHGSIFIGPDLDSYYLTYHNLVSGNGPFRRLNFDRIAWNDEKMVVLGPTDFAQQNPALPDAYDFLNRTDPGGAWSFSGGDWKMNNGASLLQDALDTGTDANALAVLDSIAEDDYTAEFNFRELERNQSGAFLGAVFGYTDASNYGIVVVNSETMTLEIKILTGDSWSEPETVDLPGTLDFSHWHTIRIEKFGQQHKFFVDGMLQHTGTYETGGGKIGYVASQCRGDFSFIAFSNKVNGSATFNVYKPVPGKLPAIQYNSGGEGTGYHLVTEPESVEMITRADEVELVSHELGGVALAGLEAGEWFNYNLNVELTRLYNINIIYRTGDEAAGVRFYLGEDPLSDKIDLPATGGEWKTFLAKDIEIAGGFGTLRTAVVSGTMDLYNLEFVVANNYSFDEKIPLTNSFGPGWKYDDGEWKINSEYAHIDGFGKRVYGSDGWRDYTVETDMMFTRSMNAGLIFRVNNPALGGAGNDPALGTDYLQGYFCGFNYGTVVLGKHNYGWERLISAPLPMEMNTWVHLRVVVNEDRIRVFVDDMTDPIIDYTDQYPFINGMAGLRSHNTGVRFRDFRVTSKLLTTSTESPEAADGRDEMLAFPNPAGDQVTLSFGTKGNRDIRILEGSGRQVLSLRSTGEMLTIPLGGLAPGIYIINAEDRQHIETGRLIVK